MIDLSKVIESAKKWAKNLHSDMSKDEKIGPKNEKISRFFTDKGETAREECVLIMRILGRCAPNYYLQKQNYVPDFRYPDRSTRSS